MKLFKSINDDNIDKVIFKIVRAMQPITAEDIWLELDENLDGELQMDLSVMEGRLEKMKILEKLDLIRAGNKKETCWRIKEQ